MDWQQRTASFAGGTNTLRWTSYNQGTNLANGPASAAWLDRVTVTNIAGLKPTFLKQPAPLMVAPELYPGVTNLIGDRGRRPSPCPTNGNGSGTNLSQGYYFYGANSPTLTLYPREHPVDQWSLPFGRQQCLGHRDQRRLYGQRGAGQTPYLCLPDAPCDASLPLTVISS